jgi:hypothetical protein
MRRIRRTALLALAIGIVAAAVAAPAARSQASQIESIAPASGQAGDRVTLTGRGFGARNVRVAVNGLAAEVLSASGDEVLFVVPQGVAPGNGTVTATNPGGRVGTIAFQVLGGILLPGHPGVLAKDAIFDVPPVAAPETEIQSGVIMTRLDVRLTPTATVGDVNSALTGINAQIASMSRGFLAITIAIPRQPNFDSLRALVATLEGAPGISAAMPATTSDEDELPGPPTTTKDHQLLPTRFPAAWNARSLVIDPATGGCRQPEVPVVIGDRFETPAPLVSDVDFSFVTFAHEIPNFDVSPISEISDSSHGSTVTLMLGALFNPEARTGANPFSNCLDITAVQVGGMSSVQTIDRLVHNFPTGKFILNFSQSFGKACVDNGERVPCRPDHFGMSIPDANQRAEAALHWKSRTAQRWPDFLVTSSAGNQLNKEPAGIYPVLGAAALNSFINAATLPDPFLGYAHNATLWQSTDAAFANLAATTEQAQNLASAVSAIGFDTVGGADNVLKVGSTTKGSTFADLTASAFSNFGPDVSAVGEGVLKADDALTNGTSFSAPQVAGLASYLWLLSPQLRAAPVRFTRQAIVGNAITTAAAPRVVDAYAAVLSLDQASTPTTVSAPIRLAILDVTGDGRFDELDLADYRFVLTDAAGGGVEPPTPDYSRYDLNGDGFTGGSQRTARFDLDRTGSTQFGAASYADVTADIEGLPVHFSEATLTDLQILCYYAYSGLYGGVDASARGRILQGLCATPVVTVDPSAVTLDAGSTQQFAAAVTGAQDPRVTWSATGGSITPTGLFTAGSVPGTFSVRAISVVDLNAFGDAIVTVRGGIKSNAGILIGGTSVPAGHIRAFVVATGFVLTRPLSERDAVLSALSDELSRVSLGTLTIQVVEPVTFTYTIGDLGQVSIAAANGATVDVTAGTLRRDPADPANFGGNVIIFATDSTVRVRAGEAQVAQVGGLRSTVSADIRSLDGAVVGNTFSPSQSNTIDLSVGLYTNGPNRGFVNLSGNADSTLRLHGASPLALFFTQNNNANLQAGSVLGNVVIDRNTLPQGLSQLTVGSVSGNLTMTLNRGFTDQEASAWAAARQVGGTVAISGNQK